MRAVLASVETALVDAFGSCDTGALSDGDCEYVIRQLARIENRCEAMRLRIANTLRSRGDRNTAEKMARAARMSSAQARREIDGRELIEQCAQTRDALDSGELSFEQAQIIAKTVAEVPEAESALIGFAKANTVTALREAARKERLGAADPSTLYERQRCARRFRHWQDDLGMVCFAGALTPDEGVAFVTRLNAQTDRVFRQACREQRREPNVRYAADAFVAMVNHGGVTGHAKRADVVVVTDLNAYRRGYAEEGEVCHIVGAGPIPVAVARDMAKDAFLKAVIHDGVAIHTIKHFGRHIPATIRTALGLGPPPAFDGAKCDDCGARIGLEIDHCDPVANGGATEASNLTARCRGDHRAKTGRDRARGLLVGRAPL